MEVKESIKEIIYKNSTDTSEGVLIRFDKIEGIINNLSMLCGINELRQANQNVDELSEKESLGGYQHHLTVGKLKEHIYEHNYNDDAPVFIQKVEDWYFTKGGWKVFNLEDAFDGESSYLQPWAPFKVKDKEILFIDMHY